MNRHDSVPGRATRIGIAAIVGAMLCFVINDALVKYASQSLPAAQLIFIRSGIAAVLVLVVAIRLGAMTRIRDLAHGRVALRSGIDAVATMLYLVSLFHLPISSAIAINMTTPLMISLLAALFLGERVGVALALATAIGFVGVLLVVQPSVEGFNSWTLVCLFSAVLLAIRDLITRRLHATVPTLLVTLSTMIAVTALAGALSLLESWVAVSWAQMAILAAAAVMLAIAYVLSVVGTRVGELSVVSPFRYSSLLFAAVVGYWVWGDTPNVLAWCGIALVIGSGIRVLRLSRRSRRSVPTVD
jgi:drug/metabolite transporter (DMT)-like permease